MLNRQFLVLVLVFSSLLAGGARADEIQDALSFRAIFINETRNLNPNQSEANIQATHMVPDDAVIQTLRATSLGDALASIRTTTIPNLVTNTSGLADQSLLAAQPAPSSQQLTIVLVPGVFAEFIQNRAFEEVLGKTQSAWRDKFATLVAGANANDSVQLIANYTPGRSANDVASNETRPLDQVLNVSDMDINGQSVHVVLFFTEFSTMESLGGNADRAKIFNRRLEKYLALTGPQKLAFVGYSRGTPLALEMLSEAKAAGRPWVNDVEAMISLSGVVWGSALADSAIDDLTSPNHKILTDLQATGRALKQINAAQSLLSLHNAPIVASNIKLWADFTTRAVANYAAMNADKSPARSIDPIRSLVLTDPRSPVSIALKMWKNLGLDHPAKGYNQNIDRFNYFVDTLVTSVQELTSQARVDWWTNNDLPLGPIYYAIPGVMANPDSDAVEASLFANPLLYGGQNNYDDASLLQNTMDYTKLTKPSPDVPGISLNDSQVSVAQSAFLPHVIASLRATNSGIKTKFLGIAGTHHWGMALRVVNKNVVTGGANGFPREAMLRSLATQVLLDNP